MTGVPGGTIEEKWLETRDGCSRKCGSVATDGGQESETENRIACERIEDLAIRQKLGILKIDCLQYWEVELLKFWVKVTEQYERNVKTELLYRVKNLFKEM